MFRIKAAFTLIELLVVVAIIALLIAILLPSLSRAREAGKRSVCGQNVKGIVTACKTYADDNDNWWPTVGSWYDSSTPATQPGAAVYNSFLTSMGGTTDLPRDQESLELSEPSPDDAATQVSPSRAMWLLIRRGDLAAGSFACPSAEDTIEDGADNLRFYDFKGYDFCSYGYQMPFARRFNQCRPRQSMEVDPRMVFTGDKNPGMTRSTNEAVQSVSDDDLESDVPAFRSNYVSGPGDPGTPLQNMPPANDIGNGGLANPELDFAALKPFNSPNHGGRGDGEGQNIGRADGSVEFVKTPLAGVDNDNIYSMIHPQPTLPFTYRSGTGIFPGTNSQNRCCPGFRGITNNRASSTDTLLIP